MTDEDLPGDHRTSYQVNMPATVVRRQATS